MAVIKSDAVTVVAPFETLRTHLENLNHYETLMTSDRIVDWQSTEDTCSFTVQGMTSIGMKREGTGLDSGIHLVSHGKNPFEFTMDILIRSVNDESCEVEVSFDGKMNFMIQTMASTPLKNLFNMMVNNLANQFS
ncbi:hypothetical protein KFE98_12045 [bacterium SCSIO 12741]|nr:hypothetical protein KFE98_12045 [bacterium SCSIO 12741]